MLWVFFSLKKYQLWIVRNVKCCPIRPGFSENILSHSPPNLHVYTSFKIQAIRSHLASTKTNQNKFCSRTSVIFIIIPVILMCIWSARHTIRNPQEQDHIRVMLSLLRRLIQRLDKIILSLLDPK